MSSDKSKRKNGRLRKKENGQAMVEFALVLPIFLLILCGILDFGWMFYNQLSLNNLCREGARYAVVNTEDDASTGKIERYIENSASGLFKNSLDIDIDYSDDDEPLNGDVTVTLSTDMNVLTPVMGTIFGGMKKQINSQVVMKVES